MPNIKSQAKRDRQNKERRLRNKARRTNVRTHMKRFHKAVDDGDAAAAQEHYRKAARRLDQAASKGVLHRNYAANKKSRMAKRLESLS